MEPQTSALRSLEPREVTMEPQTSALRSLEPPVDLVSTSQFASSSRASFNDNLQRKRTCGTVLLTSDDYYNHLKKVKSSMSSKNSSKKASVKSKSRLKKQISRARKPLASVITGDSDSDVDCLYCGDTYSRSVSREKWIRCSRCKRWAHEECCASISQNYVCDLCGPICAAKF